LLEATLGDVGPLRQTEVSNIWKNARLEAEAAFKSEQRILDLMSVFNGQRVAGRLFNCEDDIVLPHFHELIRNFTLPQWPSYPIDIVGIAENERWAVEVKASIGKGGYGTSRLLWHKGWSDKAEAISWFVVLSRVSDEARKVAGREGILISDENDVLELERLLKLRQ
jgi:hypothetical protein